MEDELRQWSKEGVTVEDSVETFGVDENQSERKSEKKQVQGEILAHQEELSFPGELHESSGQESVTSGYGASKNVES